MEKSACLLASLFAVTFSIFCSSSASADVLPVSVPPVEVAKIGLQMVREKAALDNPTKATVASGTFEVSIPVTVADVMAGTRNLAVLAPATQNYVQNNFHNYAISPQSFSEEDEKVMRAAAKISLESIVQERQVCFKLRPFIELLPSSFRQPDVEGKIGSVGYGQSINLDNPSFAIFLTSLTPVQRHRITHGGGLKMNEFDSTQKAFIVDAWQASTQPASAKYCSLMDTEVEVRFYLEADLTQTYDTGSVTYFLELPLPSPSQTSFGFDSPKQGQVWMLY